MQHNNENQREINCTSCKNSCIQSDKVQIRSDNNPRNDIQTGLAHYDVNVDEEHHTRHMDQIRQTLYDGGDIEHDQNEYQVFGEPNLLCRTVQHGTTTSRTNEPSFSNSSSTTNVNEQPFLSTPTRNSESTSWYSTTSPYMLKNKRPEIDLYRRRIFVLHEYNCRLRQ
jgi:hypothetical protein